MFTPSRFVRTAAVAIAAMVACTSAAHAQGSPGQRTWVPIDPTAPEGTPARIVFDQSASTAFDVFFDVEISGVYLEEKRGPAGETYHAVEIPSLGRPNVPGAPLLSVAYADVAVPSDDTGSWQTEIVSLSLTGSGWATFGQIQVWPQPTPQLDHEEGEDEVFQIDPAIYGSTTFWPLDVGSPSVRAETSLGHIRSSRVAMNVARWNPGTKELQILAGGRYHFRTGDGTASPTTAVPMTKERGELAALRFPNWPTVSSYFPINGFNYEAYYLIVYPEAYEATLAPFVQHKLSRGFWVSKKKLEDTGSTCGKIRTAIGAWYNATSPAKDHYVLLVGDTEEIPLCTAPDALYTTETQTDDLYGSINGDDLFEEAFVGRISMDDDADLANQLAKIIDYETTGGGNGWNRKKALLVAHKEDAPGKYVGAHEVVRTFPYANAPAFSTRYGNSASSTDAAVQNDIDAGVGIVAYRGHGSSSAWTGWNLSNQYFDGTDVSGLTNTAMPPVVWSFACTNSRLTTNDCIAEKWMEMTDSGSVAYYGATRASYTTPNHELDLAMFRSIFDLGLTAQGQAIAQAEWIMEFLHYEDNAWMYLLLGDPSMEIASDDGVIDLVAPGEIPPCTDCIVDLAVQGPGGDPVPFALVSLYKPGTDPDTPEVFANQYADANGNVSLRITPETMGTLHMSARDEAGRVVVGTIEVRDPTVAVDEPVATRIPLAAAPTIFQSATTFSFGASADIDTEMIVVDASGRLVRRFDVPLGVSSIAWDASDRAGRKGARGVYLARLNGGGEREVTRVVVLR